MGILKNEIMRTYNMRPSTAERCMEILEVIDSITKTEYERGFADGRKPTWIPCSERLPDIRHNVLITDGYHTAEGQLQDNGDWVQYRWTCKRKHGEIIAWCELPEPWRGEEHES